MKTDLTKTPDIVARMTDHLIKAGYATIESLKGADPNEIYAKNCIAQGI